MKRKVREIRFYSRSGKSQGVLYQVREILNPCSKSVKFWEFYIEVAANYVIRCFRHSVFKIICHSYFWWFMTRKSFCTVSKIARFKSGKRQGFCLLLRWVATLNNTVAKYVWDRKVSDLISDFSWCCTKNGSADQPSSGSQEQRGYILLQLYCALSRVLCRRWPDG